MNDPTAAPASDPTVTRPPATPQPDDTSGESTVDTTSTITIPRMDPIDAGRITASEAPRAVITTTDVSCYYGSFRAVNEVTMDIGLHEITALIGPSGCGKSTVLRALNRMNDLIPGTRVTGTIAYHGMDIYGKDVDPIEVRRRIGMVFQKPNPFPKSIYDNVAFGIRLYEKPPKSELDDRVEGALRRAALWDEVKDKLKSSGMGLSGGQQQRLCIARTIAQKPEVILFDEPTSALDPISTGKIEDLLEQLKSDFTIAIVTHNMQQAARISQYTAFMYLGEVIEFAPTNTIFMNPAKKQTQDYVTGRFG